MPAIMGISDSPLRILFRVTYDIAIDVYFGEMFDPDLLQQLTFLYQPPVTPDLHAVISSICA
jgi:hypothetical protein